MSEIPGFNPEQHKDQDADRKKYAEAIHQLFFVLLDFRKRFGSTEYDANEVRSAESEHNNAFSGNVRTGTVSELKADYQGLEVGVRVNLVDDLAVYTAEQDGDDTNPEPFVINLWAKKANLHFNYATDIFIGTKSAYEDGVLWSDGTVPDEVIEAMKNFVAYFRSYDEILLASDYGNIEELRLDADDIAVLTKGLQRFMDDGGIEYQLLESENDENERLANEQN